MTTVRNPVVLITGCSSGIGLALAKAFHQTNRYRVVATARESSIHVLHEHFEQSAHFMIRRLDVTLDDEMDDLLNEVTRTWGGVDILINNAGISYRSVIEQMDLAAEMDQLKVNYLGPMSLIRLVLPTMRERGAGHIINVSSVSGMVAMPTMGSYSASKHALEGATEALWYEATPFGIHVSLIQPGFVHSNSYRNVRISKKARMSADLDGPYVKFYSMFAPFVERLMNLSMGTPDKIALKIVKLVEHRNPALWVPVTTDAKLFAWLRKLLPRCFFHKLMFRLLPGSDQWGLAHRHRLKMRALVASGQSARLSQSP